MRRLNPILLIVLLMASHLCRSQQQSIWHFQKDDSLLKKVYGKISEEKKQAWINAAGTTNAASYKKIYNQHFSEIDEFWRSSRSVTDPVAHRYLQAITARIVDANPALKGAGPRIVFSRDWWPNAYSMGDGTIAVNAGLLIFLNNEAELVFVLSHELAHLYLDHTGSAIRKYVESVNDPAFQQELKRLSKSEYNVNHRLEELSRSFAFSSRKHTRDNEAAADRMAFTFMKRTGYDCRAIASGLSLLDKIDDSLIARPAALQELFQFGDYPFKAKWVQKESSIFSAMDENDQPLTKQERDSLKTHPDCSKRIAWLMDSINAATPGKQFLVNETLFAQLKRSFFIEMSEQCYRDNNISRNFYYSLMLMHDPLTRPLAVYSITRDLNEIYYYQKNHKLGSKVDLENRLFPADYNQLLRMIGKLRLDEIQALNSRFCLRYAPEMEQYSGFAEEFKKAQQQ